MKSFKWLDFIMFVMQQKINKSYRVITKLSKHVGQHGKHWKEKRNAAIHMALEYKSTKKKDIIRGSKRNHKKEAPSFKLGLRMNM